MSTLTQFVGGNPPVGSFVPAVATFGVNYTLNGAEYLQTGYLKAYSAAYASVISGSKTLGTKNTPPTSTNFYAGQGYYEFTGGSTMMAYTSAGTTNYYLWTAYNNSGPGATSVTWATSTTATPTAINFPNIFGTMYMADMVIFNNQLLTTWNYYSTSTTGYDELYNVVGGTATATLQMRAGTGNVSGFKVLASPTLAIMVGNDLQSGGGGTVSGNCYTSTNGTTWFARTNNIVLNGIIMRAEYFASAGLFIFVTNTGYIYTSPDGYTFTQRTAPTGMISPSIGNGQYYKNFSSSMSGLAVIYLGGTQFLYTTDGITYALSSTADYSQNPQTFNVMPTNYGFVVGTDGTRILIGNYSANYLAYSTTGLNFQLDFRRTGYITYGFSNANYGPRVSGFYKFGSTVYMISEYRGSGNYVLDITGTIGTSTPDLVGQQSALTAYGNFSSYLRIG